MTDERSADPLVTPGGAAAERDAEAALIARARLDRRAFAPLYVRYLPRVYGYCYRRLGQREAAEDATSRTFVRALASLATYREGNFGGWLFAIARHAAADELGKRRPQSTLDVIEDPVDAGPTPEEAALAGEEGRALRALLEQLPGDQREVVALRLAGLTGREIAGALGRSPGAVKMLQFRALTRLRRCAGGGVVQEEVLHGAV